MIKKVVTTTPTSDAYSAGDALGTGSYTVPGVFSANRPFVTLQSILVQDLTSDTPELVFMFFDSATTSTLTNDSAFAIGADDLHRCIAAVSVTAITNMDDCAILYLNNIEMPLYAANPGGTSNDDNNLYFMIMVGGTSPADWNDKTDLPVVFGFK